MKDYYQILGIGDRASQEEIHDRWLELTENCHPGLEEGDESKERIQEINEAYQTLKTPTLKFEYDLRRNFKRSVLDHVANSREKRRFRFKKMIFYCLISAIFFVAGSFTLFFETPWVSKKNNGVVVPEATQSAGLHSPLKPEEFEESQKPETPVKIAEMVPPDLASTESPGELQGSPMVAPPKVEKEPKPTKELSVAAVREPELPKRVAQVAPREPSGAVISKEPKESPVSSPLEVERKSEPIREASATAFEEPEGPSGSEKDALSELSRKEIPKESKESPSAYSPEVKRKSESIKEIPDPDFRIPGLPAREAKVIPLPPNRTAVPEVAKIPTSSLVLPPVSRESEVRQFLARYTDRYNHKDIEGFISFFSPNALQNQKDDIGKIRKVYASFFQQNEELRYKISILKIEPHKNGLQVMADYELEGILKKGRERKIWKGQVRWVLIEEKGAFKVLSLDYQPQKSRN